MPKPTITLISPHSVEECRRRLQENVSSSWIPALSGKKLAGAVYAKSFRIKKIINYRNSLQIFLFGTFKSDQNRTIITGEFGHLPFLRIFKYLWFGVLSLVEVLVGIPALIFILKHGVRNNWDTLMTFVVPTFLLLFHILLFVIGPMFAKGEPEFIKKFLMELLDAREVENPALTNPKQG